MMMRRILTLVTAATVMAAMLAASAMPAFADTIKGFGNDVSVGDGTHLVKGFGNDVTVFDHHADITVKGFGNEVEFVDHKDKFFDHHVKFVDHKDCVVWVFDWWLWLWIPIWVSC